MNAPAPRRLSLGMVCFPSVGGSGVVASELALGLAARGHEVHLLASARPTRSLPGADGLFFHAIEVPGYPLFEHAPYALAVASKIVEVARDRRLDLVQVHYAVPHAASAYLAKQLLGPAAPPFVTSLHGTDVTRVGAEPAYREVTAFTVAASDGITVPSDFLRREALQRLGLAPHVPVEVLPNFVDTDHFTPAHRRDRGRFDTLLPESERGSPVLFHVSNFRAVKRMTDLMEVLARVRARSPARLVLVGAGPERERAERRAVELGLRDHVCFLGSRRDFVDDLRHADAFLLPSETESFGVAALEALSAGVPVFAYRTGGLPEVVVEGVGRLVEPFDVDALANAVLEVISNPVLRNRFGEAARAHVEKHYRREPALDRWEAWLRGLVERAGTKEHR